MNFSQLKEVAITEGWDEVYISWVTDKIANESNKRKDSLQKLRKWSSYVLHNGSYSIERLGVPRTSVCGADKDAER